MDRAEADGGRLVDGQLLVRAHRDEVVFPGKNGTVCGRSHPMMGWGGWGDLVGCFSRWIKSLH